MSLSCPLRARGPFPSYFNQLSDLRPAARLCLHSERGIRPENGFDLHSARAHFQAHPIHQRSTFHSCSPFDTSRASPDCTLPRDSLLTLSKDK